MELEKIKKEYESLKEIGMFWEFFPELSGNWEKDKEFFINFVINRNKIECWNENERF